MYENELRILVDDYKKRLLDFEKNNKKIEEHQVNYYNYLRSSANGKCNCGKNLKIIKIEDLSGDNNKEIEKSIKYFFECGHGAIDVSIVENIVTSESLYGKTRNGIKGKVAATIERLFRINKESNNKEKHPENVDEEIIIDKENDRYYQKVIDRKTGNIVHEEDEKLSNHK